jgi:hypothetical protein
VRAREVLAHKGLNAVDLLSDRRVSRVPSGLVLGCAHRERQCAFQAAGAGSKPDSAIHVPRCQHDRVAAAVVAREFS